MERNLNAKEVAAILNIKEDTVYTLCTQGKLRSYRPKHLARRLIPESAVKEFLEGSSLAPVIPLRRQA